MVDMTQKTHRKTYSDSFCFFYLFLLNNVLLFKVFFLGARGWQTNEQEKKCPDEQTQKFFFLQKLLPNVHISTFFFKEEKLINPPWMVMGINIPWNIAQSFFIFDIIPTPSPVYLLKECDKNHNIMVCGLPLKDDDAKKNWIQSSFLSISHFLDDVSLDYNPKLTKELSRGISF